MCGIFAYLGERTDSGKIVVRGLQKLEYRGYDSFGFAEQKANGSFAVTRQVGKISDFSLTTNKFAQSHLALGHTRWATHGGVTRKNAHPHTSSDGQVVVVHNGIVENYVALKKALLKKGYKFASETDTEVIANLVADKLHKSKDLKSAARAAARELTGRFAFVVSQVGTESLVAARRGSPLILGLHNFYPKSAGHLAPKVDATAFFLASDVPAFLEYTREVVYLDDEELAEIVPSPRGDHYHAHFFQLTSGQPVAKRVISIELAVTGAEKGDYEHYMLKEIMEQKETLVRAVDQDAKQLAKVADLIRKSYGTFLIGCGTAGKVCHTAEYFFADIARRHINVIAGSEFDTQEPFLTSKTLLLAVSQSGETADVLEAYEVARRRKVKTVGVVNVEGSTIARQSSVVLPVRAGPEKAVASTKATTAQLAIMLLLAYAVAGQTQAGQQLLIRTAAEVTEMLNPRYAELIARIAKKLQTAQDIFIIGKAAHYPMALEAAIKLQEVTYIHAQGFAAGELKHGPLALIAKGTPLIAFVPLGKFRHDVLASAHEVKARGGLIIGISAENDPLFDHWIRVPDCGAAQPIVDIIPVQLLAYQLAVLRGVNPDLPRNLAKSVTVK
jgi:glucosamine--fructose-6-phosphate aminotransferase (isomerizing)